MKYLFLILFISLGSAVSAQELDEPSFLVVDSAIETITDFNDLLFSDYALDDAQVKNKQLHYTFQANGRPINCFYNLARNVAVDDPTKITPRYITDIVIEGEGSDLAAIYNKYFGTKTDLGTEKNNTKGHPFTYHGVKYNCTIAPIAGSSSVWRMSIEHP